MAVNQFVYVYARLAHARTPGCFYMYDCRSVLVQFNDWQLFGRYAAANTSPLAEGLDGAAALPGDEAAT